MRLDEETTLLIDTYQKFLDSVRMGNPRFPLKSSETYDKVCTLLGEKAPNVFVADLPEMISDLTVQEVQAFVDRNRNFFPVKNKGIIVGLESDRYILESALYALVTGREWIGLKNWIDIPKDRDAKSLLIFGAPETFTQKVISKLISLLSKEVGHSRWMEIPFGLMTGMTRDVLLFMMYKNLYFPTNLENKPLYLNAFALDRKQYNDQHVELITRDECDVEYISKLLSVLREVTVFSGHGHEDCYFLGRTSIFPAGLREGKIVSNDPDLPLSAYGRGKENPNVVFTDQFRTKILFANTCCGIRTTNGLFPSQFGIGMNFLEGSPAAYISTFMVKGNSEHEPFLFSRLAMQKGMRIGEAVRVINNLLFQDTNDFPCYLLIGDPEITFQYPVIAPVAGTLFVEDGGKAIVIESESEGGYLISITLQNQSHASLLRSQRSRLKEVRFNGRVVKDDLRYFFHEQDVYLYSIKPMPAGKVQIVLELIENKELASVHFDIDKYSMRLEYLNAMKLFEQKYKGLAEEINNSIKAIGPLHQPSLYSLKQANRYSKLMSRITSNFQRLQESIIEMYLTKVDKGSWAFTEMYSDDFLAISRKMLDQKCPYCSNELLQKRIVHPVYRQLQRELTICPRCGIIKDCPISSFLIHMRGSESVRQGETLTKTVTYENTTDSVQMVTIGLGIERTKLALYPFKVEKAIQTRVIQPGETVNFRFDVKIHEECVAHSFYLKAFILSNLEIACLHNILFVLPKRRRKIEQSGTTSQI